MTATALPGWDCTYLKECEGYRSDTKEAAARIHVPHGHFEMPGGREGYPPDPEVVDISKLPCGEDSRHWNVYVGRDHRGSVTGCPCDERSSNRAGRKARKIFRAH